MVSAALELNASSDPVDVPPSTYADTNAALYLKPVVPANADVKLSLERCSYIGVDKAMEGDRMKWVCSVSPALVRWQDVTFTVTNRGGWLCLMIWGLVACDAACGGGGTQNVGYLGRDKSWCECPWARRAFASRSQTRAGEPFGTFWGLAAWSGFGVQTVGYLRWLRAQGV